MMALLKKATVTGIDENNSYSDILNLINKFDSRVPFFELGILFSKSNYGDPRFPDPIWVIKFITFLYKNCARGKVDLSLHICGSVLRNEICFGDWSRFRKYPDLINEFNRIQLNFHSIYHDWDDVFYDGLKEQNKQIIFQMDGKNGHLYFEAKKRDINCVPFFDLSHGAGILPKEWPKAIGPYCGFAGGLSPENITEELKKIHRVANEHDFWVDIESNVRTNNILDIEKVDNYLSFCQAFIPIR